MFNEPEITKLETIGEFGLIKHLTQNIELKNNTVINTNDHKRFKWYFSEGYVISNNNPVGKRTYADSGVFKILLISMPQSKQATN